MKYIIKGLDNKTLLIKTNKEIGNVSDRKTLYTLLDKLYDKGFIDLDKKEDLEFGSLYIPRDIEYDCLIRYGFKVYEI